MTRPDPLLYSSIAQTVEHATVNRRVVGSSPTWGASILMPPLFFSGGFFLTHIGAISSVG